MSNNTTKSLIGPSEKVAHFEKDVWSIFTPLAAETKAINLGQGFMNFNPPDFVQEAANEAISDVAANQYSHPKGRPRLRKALADSYSPLFGRELDPENEIIVTAGANEGMFATFAGFLDEGSEVICMEPFFDQYISNITMNGGVPVFVPLRAPAKAANENISSHEWKLDINELRSKITDKTRMIVINTPHNPIGKVFDEEELLEIGKVAEEHNLLILSDEVYDRLYYEPAKQVRIATLKDFWKRTITVGSGGKSFAATGWRVGWLIGPSELIQYSLAAHTRVVFCVNSPCQEAIAIGLEKTNKIPYFQDQIQAYTKKRQILSSVFEELGLPYTVPDGSYFILVNTTKVQFPQDYPFPAVLDNRAKDFKLCYWLAKEIGVVAIPPSEFYSKENRELAADFARFAFCKSDDVLEDAVKALRKLAPYIKQ
ncbi:arylformamidase [Umbelopsis sp. WA50703]